MRYFDIYDCENENKLEILEITVSDNFICKCKEILEKNSFVNKKSFMNGERSLTGILGEFVIKTLISKEWKLSVNKTEKSSENLNYYDYDLFVDNKKIEVKSKTCKSIPKSNYEGSIPSYYKQKCDYYVFNRILNDFKTIWIMGFISKEDFENKRRKIRKGETDQSNGLVFKENAYNIFYHELNSIREFKNVLMGG